MIASEHWGLPEAQFWLRGERPADPVRQDPGTGGAHVYGHAEALRVLGDPRSYSSNTARLQPQMQEFVEGDLLQRDPPEHAELRTLVSRAFTPKVVAGLEPRIAEITRELLDRADGRLDLVADVAHPLPAIVIAELLGVPADERDLFTGWVDVALGGANSGEFDADPEQAKAHRKRLLDKAAMDRLLVAGPHLDFPTFAHIERANEGYAFIPDVWRPFV